MHAGAGDRACRVASVRNVRADDRRSHAGAGTVTAIAATPSKASQVLAVLREAPATTGEVAAELGWDTHLTCAHLKNLHIAGRVARKPFPTGDKRVRFIWSLPNSEAAHVAP